MTIQRIKNIYHFGQSYFWRMVYGWPDRGLKLYGVTGTNGKTTTCYVLCGILAEAYGQEKVGMLTTVAHRVGSEEEINTTKLTTLPSRMVWKYLARMRKAGVEQVALEMTSHALDQHRLAGVALAGAIWLNVEREHLDYHRTMAEYAAAKAHIFDYVEDGAPVVVKGDDEWIRKHIGERPVTKFTAEEALSQETSLTGSVNRENALAAGKLALNLGIGKDVVRRGLMSVRSVPGRMEWLDESDHLYLGERNVRVLIDYAVTPDALRRLYKEVAADTQGRVLGVVGAAGLRDRGKRPEMARAVAAEASVLVVTREDPWTESEEQIFEDLEEGLKDYEGEWKRIVDRREALEWLLGQANAGDVVVVTGKGAERGMALADGIIPWNDREVIMEILDDLLKV